MAREGTRKRNGYAVQRGVGVVKREAGRWEPVGGRPPPGVGCLPGVPVAVGRSPSRWSAVPWLLLPCHPTRRTTPPPPPPSFSLPWSFFGGRGGSRGEPTARGVPTASISCVLVGTTGEMCTPVIPPLDPVAGRSGEALGVCTSSARPACGSRSSFSSPFASPSWCTSRCGAGAPLFFPCDAKGCEAAVVEMGFFVVGVVFCGFFFCFFFFLSFSSPVSKQIPPPPLA